MVKYFYPMVNGFKHHCDTLLQSKVTEPNQPKATQFLCQHSLEQVFTFAGVKHFAYSYLDHVNAILYYSDDD